MSATLLCESLTPETCDYDAADADGTIADIKFFYAPSQSAAGRMRIPCVPPVSPGVCKWRAVDAPNGDYYIHMIIVDDDGGRKVIVSEAPVRVNHS